MAKHEPWKKKPALRRGQGAIQVSLTTKQKMTLFAIAGGANYSGIHSATLSGLVNKGMLTRRDDTYEIAPLGKVLLELE